MECLKSPFLYMSLPSKPHSLMEKKKKKRLPPLLIRCSIQRDPWSPSFGDPTRPKPRTRNPKTPLSDDNARRIIKKKAAYQSILRRNQGPQAQTPRWIKRTPEQMLLYLQDDRNGHLYGKHVVAAIKKVRSLSQKVDGDYDMRMEMASFVGKLSFKEMCVVLKEQKGWRQVRDFFSWMKLQLSYRPSVVVYTIVLRLYGQVGKLKLAEEIFLEMLDVDCEPDEVACGTMLCSYARWGRHRAMLSFYSAVKERGTILSVSVFNFMMSSLQKKSLHREVVQMWKDMLEKGVIPNSFTYTVSISSLVKEGLYEDAFKTFDEMRNNGVVPEEVTYNLLINLSAKSGNRDEVQRLYEDMIFRGIVPSNYTCASLLSLYYKYEDYPRALSIFSQMVSNKIPADEVIYGLLIRIYGKLGLYEDAHKAFEETNQRGQLTSEKTYLAMAQVHLTSGNVDKALQVIERMKSSNIWFSRFAYIVLLQCYVMKEDVVSAERTFLALSKTGPPDAGSCNDMLSLYVGLNLMNKAKEFIIQIREDGKLFDKELYRTVMKVYCKEGMLPEAEQFTNQMVENESFQSDKFFKTFYWILYEHKGDAQSNDELVAIEPIDKLDATALGLMLSLFLTNDNFSGTKLLLKLLLGYAAGGSKVVCQLIINLCKEGEISKAELLNDQLIKLGCRMEEATVASLISHYGKRQMLKQAEDIFAEYVNPSTSSKQLYNSMINAYAKCGKQEKAYLLYKQVTEEGHDLGAVGMSIAVNSLTNAGKHLEAENFIYSSLKNNLELDTVAYNTFIKAMLQAGMILEASQLFSKMQKEGIKPGKVSYNIMINVYASAGDLRQTDKIFQAMQRQGCLPDSFTYLSLIQGYTRNRNYHKAEETLHDMQSKGIPPSCVHFNILVNAFTKAGLIEEAKRVYEELSTFGLVPDLVCYRTMLNGYLKYGYVEEGINFFESIHESTKGDRFIMSAAVHFYRSSGKESKAKEILNSMNNKGIPFLKNLEVGSEERLKTP
ncbi:Pentatricopeptide repeat-containing protein [Vigna angularis]|uniref:Pentatricopeptide repeat-containing protein n=1 Tax=Phaseolus angularis TaxID=3914 RepID=A0A8T0LGY7_PHAAN|nr:Pentatricopeptide repeat-containing protein [Vigna angularis]